MLQLRQLIFFFLFYFIHSGHVFLSNKILSQIQSIANNTLAHINKKNSSLLSEKCKNILNEAISREDGSYIIKLYTDSTPTHNNLKGYSTCYDGFYPNLKNRTTYDIKDNLTFLIFSYKNELSKEAISLNSYSNVFGVCVPKGCSIEEYETIFLEFRDLYNVIPNVMNNKFFVTDLKEENEYKNKYFIIFLQFIPCFILLCFVLLVFFPELVYAFTCCCSNTKRNEYEKCFEFKENLNELLPSSNNTKIHNENGLEIVSGLRGIGMILLVCGLVLKNLFITPVKKYTEKEFEIYMGEPFFSMLFFCSKFGYKFLYSISGFSLVYKFLFFLDNEVKTIQGQKEIAESFLLRNSFSSAYGLFRGNLNYKVLFKFIKKQINKYILFILFIVFIRYYYFEIHSYIFSHGQFWFYLRNSFNSLFNINILASTVFLYSSLWKGVSDFYNSFLPIMNEIFFFLLSSFIIFIFYKKNWRLDIFIIFGVLFVIIGKIIFFLIVWFDKEIDPHFYPIQDFLQYKYFWFRDMSLTNLSYYFIGMFFGIGNYSIQKTYVDYTVLNASKKFTILPSTLFQFYLKKTFVKSKVLITGIIFGLAFIFFIFNFFILSFIFGSDFEFIYFRNFTVNLIAIFENEIVISLVFVVVIESFYLTQGVIHKIVKITFFKIISRTYFSFLLLIGFLTNFIFISSESRFNVKTFVMLFYILLVFIIGFTISVFLYVVIEIPFKKMNILLTKEEKTVIDENDSQFKDLGELIKEDLHNVLIEEL